MQRTFFKKNLALTLILYSLRGCAAEAEAFGEREAPNAGIMLQLPDTLHRIEELPDSDRHPLRKAPALPHEPRTLTYPSGTKTPLTPTDFVHQKIVPYLKEQIAALEKAHAEHVQPRTVVVNFFKKTAGTHPLLNELSAYEQRLANEATQLGEQTTPISGEFLKLYASYKKLASWDKQSSDFDIEEQKEIKEFLTTLITRYCTARQTAKRSAQ